MSEFLGGLSFWWRGWVFLLKSPRFLTLAILPLILSMLFIVPFFWFIFSQLPQWSTVLVSVLLGWTTEFWQDVVYYPLFLSALLAVIIGSFFLVYVLHSILAIPFYSRLAEQTVTLRGKKSQGLSFWRMLRAGLIKTAVLLPVGFIFFLISFVPGLNLIALFGSMLILAFDIIDYSFEAVGFGFRERVGYLLRHRGQWLGMAAGLALTLPVPAFTLLIIPGAVTGAALILKIEHELNHEF